MNLSPKSTLTLPIALAVVGVISLIGTGWRMANAMRDMKDEITALRRDVQMEMTTLRRDLSEANRDRWSTSDMERWAFRFERENRAIQLRVPDVREVKNERVPPGS